MCVLNLFRCIFFFFFNDTAPTEIYPLSLHDALPICLQRLGPAPVAPGPPGRAPRTGRGEPRPARGGDARRPERSEEHTSELQSLAYLVCRLLLEKKKIHNPNTRERIPMTLLLRPTIL